MPSVDPALELSRKIASQPELRNAGTVRKVKKGEGAFRSGDETKVFFLESGLVKLCFTSQDGREWIRSFVAAPGVFSHLYLQSEQEDNIFSAMCLEDCTFTLYSYDLLRSVGVTHPDLARAGFDVVQYYLLQRERRMRNMLSLSAEDAYKDFLREHANIAGRITQADTSRYLGITPVALSRIRQRMTTSA